MSGHAILLSVHILSAAVLFGTGLGIAWFMWMAWRVGNVAALAVTLRHVVVADFVFTATAVVVQPATGIALIVRGGHDPAGSWLVWSYGLYALAAACWLPVVAIQCRLARLARLAVETGAPIPPEAERLMRVRFWLGWPAFIAVIAITLLMVWANRHEGYRAVSTRPDGVLPIMGDDPVRARIRASTPYTGV